MPDCGARHDREAAIADPGLRARGAGLGRRPQGTDRSPARSRVRAGPVQARGPVLDGLSLQYIFGMSGRTARRCNAHASISVPTIIHLNCQLELTGGRNGCRRLFLYCEHQSSVLCPSTLASRRRTSRREKEGHLCEERTPHGTGAIADEVWSDRWL